MRVVAGSARGLRLDVPSRGEVRPTTDRVREAVFNALFSMDLIEGASMIDLFAGTGALGIEALSRGAGHVTFVERDRRTADTLAANLDRCGVAERADVVVADAFSAVAAMGDRRFDVALLDPPHDFDEWLRLLASTPADLLVIESNRSVDVGSDREVVRERRYGTTVVAFARSHRHPDEPAG